MKTEQLFKLSTSVRSRKDSEAPVIPSASGSESVDFGQALDTNQTPHDQDRASDLKWITPEEIEREVQRANVLAERLPNRPMSFDLEYEDEMPVVRITLRETNEVVRQMSPGDFLNFMAAVQQTVGLFFDRLA